jgi:hypothetical protein
LWFQACGFHWWFLGSLHISLNLFYFPCMMHITFCEVCCSVPISLTDTFSYRDTILFGAHFFSWWPKVLWTILSTMFYKSIPIYVRESFWFRSHLFMWCFVVPCPSLFSRLFADSCLFLSVILCVFMHVYFSNTLCPQNISFSDASWFYTHLFQWYLLVPCTSRSVIQPDWGHISFVSAAQR